MRIAIREQLTILMILAVLVGLAIVAIPTWVYVNQFVVNIKRDGLALSASLKASRITAELELLQQTCNTITSRVLIQKALVLLYDGQGTDAAWDLARADLSSALSASTFTGLLQGRIYSRNVTNGSAPLLNITATNVSGSIVLPYHDDHGGPVYLSDTHDGYPRDLYPNITYVDLGRPNPVRPKTHAFAAEAFPDIWISQNQGLLLGPLIVNSTYALVSLSVPIRDNSDGLFILGYMTLVAAASSLIQIRDSKEGLGNTGMTLLVGPKTPWNRFDAVLPPSNATFLPDDSLFADVAVQFVVPPKAPAGQEQRHERHQDASIGRAVNVDHSFSAKDYPAVFESFTTRIDSVNNQSAMISTTNERGVAVAVGFARTSTPLVNWTVLVEQTRGEAFVPIVTLRNILLGTVLGTAGFLLIIVFPCAHISVLPIRRLKDATEKTTKPPGYEDGYYDSGDETPVSGNASNRSRRSGKGLIANVKRFMHRKSRPSPSSDNGRETTRRTFNIPGKVEDKRHYIRDELTELTKTFNDMSDELVRQYTSLDEKVAARTSELELSKKAAEAANESKTLFIANISHELKTPLNGILGMCAVCMEENDIVRIKQSLKTLYKSGDLLLHLLEDLLSFSKNQIGQQLSLEEKEFSLADIRSQILTIFDKQVREGNIKFSVEFLSSEGVEGISGKNTSTRGKLPAIGPGGIGRLKDMCLWGDQHRVLQVIINLVSNSLKFTPAGGSVSVRIKCLWEFDTPDESRASSSLRSSVRVGRSRQRMGSGNSTTSKATTTTSIPYKSGSGTALTINPMDPKATPHVQVRERSPSPPPPNAKPFMFEFEVEDTGPGIPEHMQQRVFEPFVQGDLGLSRKFGGTGLGLSICHQLATIMGGDIALRSTVGVGSTFTMRIPLKYVKNRPSSTASSSVNSRSTSMDAVDREALRNGAAKPSVDVPSTPPPPPTTTPAVTPTTAATAALEPKPRLVGLSLPFFSASPSSTTSVSKSAEARLAAIHDAVAKKEGQGKLRVLVADDNSTNVEVVSRMLKLEDVIDVTIAKDGQEAYDLVKATMENNQRFDLIFMDIQMPNLDGLQSTRLIRKMGYKSPIVALTAFSEESNVKECMESGMDEFLSKPIRRPALKQVLRKFATIPEEPETMIVNAKATTKLRESAVTADTAANGHAEKEKN